MDKTKIQISKETWKNLNDLKEAGDSFDDVLQKLLKFWWRNTEEGEL